MAQLNVNPRELIFTRTFHKPARTVFKSWTDPAQLAQWWGPKGFTNPICKLDVRSRGMIRIDMQAPDGCVYPMSGTYVEIIKDKKIVFTSSALDQTGKPIFEVLSTATFNEVDGKTRLEITATVTKTSPQAVPYLEGMEEGWTQSLARLADHLT